MLTSPQNKMLSATHTTKKFLSHYFKEFEASPGQKKYRVGDKENSADFRGEKERRIAKVFVRVVWEKGLFSADASKAIVLV